MSLPTFLTRIHNAAGPLLGGIAESELGEELSTSSLLLEIDADLAAEPAHRAAYLLAANLGARLYPRLSLDGPDELVARAAQAVSSINPRCEFGQAQGKTMTLSWRGGEASAERVTVAARGWSLSIDEGSDNTGPAATPAALAAATLGIGELFRALFATRLPQGRTAPQPFSLDLLSLEPQGDSPPVPEEVGIGTVHLAGCGAIGQAFVTTLRELPVTGKLIAVDHEAIEDGNLQRYLLAGAEDIGTAKPALIERALAEHPLSVKGVPTRWGEDARTAPGQQTIVSALDSKQGRIELQGGLPRELFNAWTQPEDLGVSRHQAFGEDPCLACLGWPTHRRPSESARIAAALDESELRVVRYLLSGIPVGQPLAPEQIQGSRRLPLPEDATRWLERSLLEDLIDRFGLPRQQFATLAGLPIGALYRDAVCAGMLIEHRRAREEEVSVPLAHQSTLAGIMLATWLFADRVPELRERLPQAKQARYDVLRGGEQLWGRMRGREARCICSDQDFLAAYHSRWNG